MHCVRPVARRRRDLSVSSLREKKLSEKVVQQSCVKAESIGVHFLVIISKPTSFALPRHQNPLCLRPDRQH